MIRQWLTFWLVMGVYALVAQPVNDNCSGLIDLGTAPACPTTIFSNVNATATDIGFGNNPTCFNGGATQRDVWFAFTASDTIFDYTITVTGITDGGTPSIVNPQVAIYRGDCELDGLAELLCASADLGETSVELDVEGLTPGVTYFLRINDYSASGSPNAGAFQLCVDEQDPISLIDEGGSTACSGELYDSGGPDGDYGVDEDHVFTICPSQPSACITFTLDYYNIEPGGFFGPADQLIFYDSDEPDPNAILANIAGAEGGFNPSDVAAGGAVCFQVQASSGCLTVQFISDAFTNFQGFAGSWECSTQACDPYDPITVSTDVDEIDIVDALSTPQTQVTITSINCAAGAYGVFNAGDETDLGLERGLLLTTGDVEWAPGPNSSTGFGNPNADRFFPGDADLDSLSILFGDGTVSQDACILELDVLASTDELTFEYIFGSDEYPEFVDDAFNDIFAFLISGPGIAGLPQLNNQLNIATLPNPTNTIVQINSVNNLLNWEYYRNNALGQSLEYDGLTSDFLGIKKSLTARAQVIPCSTYHLKLAIADRGDGIFDSGVFISDIRGGTPNITVRFNSGIDYLLEACTEQADEVLIQLNNPIEDTVTYNVIVSGTATPNEDYLLDLPSSVTFLPGQTEFSFPISVLTDLDVEGIETILISLTNDFGCGEVTYTTVRIEIQDQLRVDINAGQDTAFFCPDGSLMLEAEGTAQYFWTPIAIFDNPLSATPVVTPGESRWVRVEGQVGPSCVAVDSIYLQLIDPAIALSALDPVTICRGDSVRLQAVDNVNGAGLSWTPTTGLSDPDSSSPVAMPLIDQQYFVSVNVTGCIATDSIFIDVDFLNVPALAEDTVLCQNYPVQLAFLENINTDDTQYEWAPQGGLDDPASPMPIATPDVTTTYQLTASTLNGACSETLSVTVAILAADVDIAPQDTAFICLGETAALTATTNTGSATGLTWSPATGLSSTNALEVTAAISQSQWYLATFVNGPCVVFDSVYVRVDSLPADLSFTLDPFKDSYCSGEQVIFTSPIYDPAEYPDIRHTWLESLGSVTPDSLYNLVIFTQDTANYVRVTENNACRDTINLGINVIEPIAPQIVPEDTTLCLGQSLQLSVVHRPSNDVTYQWEEPTAGLSCVNCPSPIAAPTSDITYTVTTEIDGECPETAAVNIRVIQPPVVDLPSIQAICPGEPLVLWNGAIDPEVVYTWTSPDLPGFTSNDPRLEVSPTDTTRYVLTTTNSCFTRSWETRVVPAPIVTLAIDGPAQVCQGQALELSALFAPAIDPALVVNSVWTTPGMTIATGLQFSTDMPTTGIYQLSLFIGQCYELNAAIAVEVLPLPTPSLIADETICLGDVRQLLTSTPQPGISYRWVSSTDPGFSSTDPSLTVSPVVTTTYELTASNICTTVVRQVTLTVIGDTELEIQGDLTICPGGSTALQVSTLPAVNPALLENTVWTWPGGTATGRILNANPEETTTYTATLSLGDCGEIMTTATVTVLPEPTVEAVAERDTVYSGGEVSISITSSPATGNTITWAPQPDSQNGSTYLFTAPTLPDTNTLDELYVVTLVSGEGCQAEATVVITVLPARGDVPNIFSPNGDMRNDRFRIFNADELSDIQIMVYNRWGQLVYESTDNTGWDGNYKGDPAPADVYIYMVKFTIGGETIEKTGELTLVR